MTQPVASRSGGTQQPEQPDLMPSQPRSAVPQTPAEVSSPDPRQHPQTSTSHYAPQAFNMAEMASIIPPLASYPTGAVHPFPYGNYNTPHVLPNPNAFPVNAHGGSFFPQQQQQQMASHLQQPAVSHYADTRGLPGYQPIVHLPQQSATNSAGPMGMQGPVRQMYGMQPGLPLQPQQLRFPGFDSQMYPVSHLPFAVPDPRFATTLPYVTSEGPFLRRSSADTIYIPNFPRGPPRKPKQSGHALWVGNLPPTAAVIELKEHFSRDATKDIESVFLIAKSNCAFVNYRSEAACVSAMSRFHDSRFQGVRLVCRLRRGSAQNIPDTSNPSSREEPASGPGTPSTSAPAAVERDQKATRESSSSTTPSNDLPTTPVIVRGSPRLPKKGAEVMSDGKLNKGTRAEPAQPHEKAVVRDRYFIVKSLTLQDLEASVRNGIWATQSHNEETLNNAYHAAENVYLIFSANKSGEYFGFARMTSPISGDPMQAPSLPVGSNMQENTLNNAACTPQYYPTPATVTAPKGRVIDDSARGTIFWEAEHSDEEDEAKPAEKRDDSGSRDAHMFTSSSPSTNIDTESGGFSEEGSDQPSAPGSTRIHSEQGWGRQFNIEWISTNRLPFYRTRGLRNPWNANREVKIARDGTELEPGIGQRLVLMFTTRPSSNSMSPSAVQ